MIHNPHRFQNFPTSSPPSTSRPEQSADSAEKASTTAPRLVSSAMDGQFKIIMISSFFFWYFFGTLWYFLVPYFIKLLVLFAETLVDFNGWSKLVHPFFVFGTFMFFVGLFIWFNIHFVETQCRVQWIYFGSFSFGNFR